MYRLIDLGLFFSPFFIYHKKLEPFTIETHLTFEIHKSTVLVWRGIIE
jgi:hypothetical protein